MKNLFIVFSFLAACIFLPACNKENGNGNENTVYTDPIKIDLSATEVQMTSESQDFAANLFSTVYGLQTSDENIAISPLSLNMALAMVWNGANGETKQAIQQAMGMSDYPQSDLNDYFQKLREDFVKTDPTVKLAIANSIWTRQGFPVKNSFYDVNKNYYQAEVKEVDFNSPGTVELINQWCSDNTNGLIKKMIDDIPSDMIMYLINALYFKGEWSHQFNSAATQKTAFTKADGSSVRVKMMNQDITLPYYHDDYLSSVSMPFGNQAFSMIFILPNENVSFAGMLDQLKQPGYFANCTAGYGSTDVDLYIPVFKIDYDIKLNETLKQLGMSIAFSDFADFSGISTVPLCISFVRQKVNVSIDEKGGEAAAVTVVGMVGLSLNSEPSAPPKVVFRADRPFLFAIRENSTGVVLFMGKVGNPE